jgi:hypothetical protein
MNEFVVKSLVFVRYAVILIHTIHHLPDYFITWNQTLHDMWKPARCAACQTHERFVYRQTSKAYGFTTTSKSIISNVNCNELCSSYLKTLVKLMNIETFEAEARLSNI